MKKTFILLLLIFFLSPHCLFAYSKNEIKKLAIQKKLYLLNRWKALLHVNNSYNKSFISDPNFILSGHDHFSLKREMLETIDAFFTDPAKYKDPNQHPLCRFPARKFFFEYYLNISTNVFPKVSCSEFHTYLKKAPVQKIYLVFASENLKDPSSIMGHLFFKLQGTKKDGSRVEHAVSFYTVIDTYEPLELIAKSLLFGMNGLFALRPYRLQLMRYLENENRNIWEYELKLNKFEKKFLYFHIWELKGIKTKYYFQGYNCATVVFYILSTGKPKVLMKKTRWISPLDVIKIANHLNIIKKGKLIPSVQWFIRMLEEQLSLNDILSIKEAITHVDYKYFQLFNPSSNNDDLIKLELARAYAYFLYKEKKITEQNLIELNKLLDKKITKNRSFFFDIANYKSPLRVANDSQLGFGLQFLDNVFYFKLNFLPASRKLSDDNREYFSESALEIGNINLLFNNKTLKIEQFNIYRIVSLIPFDILTKGICGKFDLNYDTRYKKNKFFSSFNINSGLGLSFKLTDDMSLFFLSNGEIGYGDNDLYATLNPAIGLSMYEIFNMKTNMKMEYWGAPFKYYRFKVTQSIFIKKDYKFVFNVNFYSFNEMNMGILFSKYF